MHFIVVKQSGSLRPSAHNLGADEARHRLEQLRLNGVVALVLVQEHEHQAPEAAVCRECSASLKLFLAQHVELA